MRRLTAIMGDKLPSTKSGEMLNWNNSVASYLPDKGAYALKLTGATQQLGIPTPDSPIPIQCVKAGSKVRVTGKNLFRNDGSDLDHFYSYYLINISRVLTGYPSVEPTFDELSRSPFIGKRMTISFDLTIRKDFVDSLLIYPYQYNGLTLYFSTVPLFGLTNGETRRVSITDVVKFELIGEQYTKGQIIVYPSNAEDRVPNNFTLSNIQIELNTEETAYEPYQDGGYVTTPCDLYEGDECYWYGDRTEVVHKNGTVDLGTLDWARAQIGPLGYYWFYAPIPTAKYLGNAFSSVFETTNIVSFNSLDNTLYIGNTQSYPVCYIRCDLYTDAATFKTAMNGVPLVYELATPTIETFPAQSIPRTFNGITNILQEPTDISGTITGTVLTPYTFNRLVDKNGYFVTDKNGNQILMA